MKIGSIGYNYSHGGDFVMDRPNGIGCGLLLIIKTPSVFVINGKRKNVRENSVVIFTPDACCNYRGAGDVYRDDWMYFGLGDEELNKFAQLGIPLNTVIPMGSTEELSRIMHILAYEHYSAEAFHEELEERYIDILLIRISRMINSGSCLAFEAAKEKTHKFTLLRSRLYTMPESAPTVGEMAEEMGLSRSGFQHLYKKIFGVSVMTDVINGRIDRAKRLLSSTDLSVREIAERCGYTGEYNFMRQFKSRCGKTPTEYRKCL